MYHQQIREAIETILKHLNPEIRYSRKAVELLMLTCAAESHGGRYIKQLGTGPARGIFQIEPDTWMDCYIHFLDYPQYKRLKLKINLLRSHGGKFDLALNIGYQICIARLIYWRKRPLIPIVHFYKDNLTPGSAAKLAQYWKRHYNTVKGKGRVQKAIDNYYEWVT